MILLNHLQEEGERRGTRHSIRVRFTYLVNTPRLFLSSVLSPLGFDVHCSLTDEAFSFSLLIRLYTKQSTHHLLVVTIVISYVLLWLGFTSNWYVWSQMALYGIIIPTYLFTRVCVYIYMWVYQVNWDEWYMKQTLITSQRSFFIKNVQWKHFVTERKMTVCLTPEGLPKYPAV